MLGGLKISDAFSMLRRVLSEGIADEVLTTGVVGQVFLLASGVHLGDGSERFIADRSLDMFVPEAAEHLETFPDRIRVPLDVAVERDGRRIDIAVDDLPVPEPIIDIGPATMAEYEDAIATAATVFVNGPAGVYERDNRRRRHPEPVGRGCRFAGNVGDRRRRHRQQRGTVHRHRPDRLRVDRGWCPDPLPQRRAPAALDRHGHRVGGW